MNDSTEISIGRDILMSSFESVGDYGVPKVSVLRPVTIKQIIDAQRDHQDAPFTIDGVEVVQVFLVAHVVHVNITPTRDAYELEDGSGRVKASHFEDDDRSLSPEIADSSYAKIIGTLGRFGETNNLRIKSIMPIGPDYHEIFYHIFHCMVITLQLKRKDWKQFPQAPLQGPPARVSPPAPPPPPHSPPPQEMSWESTLPDNVNAQVAPYQTPQNAVVAQPAPGTHPVMAERHAVSPLFSSGHRAPAQYSPPSSPEPSPRKAGPSTPRFSQAPTQVDPMSHLSRLERAIFLYILNTEHTAEGVFVRAIERGVRGMQASPEDICNALDELMEQGFIHPTNDSSHYNVT